MVDSIVNVVAPPMIVVGVEHRAHARVLALALMERRRGEMRVDLAAPESIAISASGCVIVTV